MSMPAKSPSAAKRGDGVDVAGALLGVGEDPGHHARLGAVEDRRDQRDLRVHGPARGTAPPRRPACSAGPRSCRLRSPTTRTATARSNVAARASRSGSASSSAQYGVQAWTASGSGGRLVGGRGLVAVAGAGPTRRRSPRPPAPPRRARPRAGSTPARVATRSGPPARSGVVATIRPRSPGSMPFSVRHDDPPGSRVDRDDVGHGDDDAPGGTGGLDAGRGVLDRHALHRVDAEALGRQQVRLGVRLAVLDGVAGDDGLERDRRQRLDDGVDEPATTTSSPARTARRAR